MQAAVTTFFNNFLMLRVLARVTIAVRKHQKQIGEGLEQDKLRHFHTGVLR